MIKLRSSFMAGAAGCLNAHGPSLTCSELPMADKLKSEWVRVLKNNKWQA